MRKSLAALALAVLVFTAGFVVSRLTDAPPVRAADAAGAIPAAAFQSWYPPVGEYENDGEPIEDERFDALMAAFDAAMTSDETLGDIDRSVEPVVQGFLRRIAIPVLSETQQETATAYIRELVERHPEQSDYLDRQIGMIGMYGGDYPVLPSFMVSVRSFAYPEGWSPEGGAFEDAQIDGMLAALDAMLALPEVVADFEREAGHLLRDFTQRLQRGQVADGQTERIFARFDALAADHPELAETIGERRDHIDYLLPGRVARNIVGKDTEGVEFELEDYRGQIVVLVFSGEWCGPCRGEYPYHRFAMEHYKDDPVVLLGVNSDADVETIRNAKAAGEAPAYRTWWDGHSQPDAGVAATNGPTATAWNVRAWPSIFVLDQEGVIRHIGTRGGNLITTLDRMVMDVRRAEREAAQAATEETGTEG